MKKRLSKPVVFLTILFFAGCLLTGIWYITRSKVIAPPSTRIPSDARLIASATLPAGWTVLREASTDTAFYEADCASATECYVAGGPSNMEVPGEGFVLRTQDAGSTWNQILTSTGYVFSVEFKAPSHIGAAARYGQIHVSHDNGATWQMVNPVSGWPGNPLEDKPFYKFHWNGDSDAYVTGRKHIYRTRDNGATWSYFFITDETVPFGLDCANDTTCLASGTGGKAYRTTDRGTTWILAKPTNYWNHTLDVAFPTLSKVYLSGGDDTNATSTYGTGGVLFTSADAGQSWTQLTIPQSGDVTAVRCVDSDTCAILSADNGMIHQTSDGGATWTTTDLGYVNRLLDMEYLDDDHLLVVGKGVILGYGMASGGGGATATPTPSPTVDPNAPTPTTTPTTDPMAPTPTITPTSIPGQATATPTPTGQTNTTLTPSTSRTPSPTPLPTTTSTPSDTPTATPIPTATPTITPTPILASFCDTTCGQCGWRDTGGICHPDGKIDGSGDACCYRTCVGRRCTLVSGYGTEGNCIQDAQCQEDRIASVPTATPKTVLTSLPQTGQGSSPTRPAGVTSVTPGGGGAPVAGDTKWLLWLIAPVVIILGAVVI